MQGGRFVVCPFGAAAAGNGASQRKRLVQRATLKREVPVVSCVCWAPQCPSPLVGSELYFGHSDWELEK